MPEFLHRRTILLSLGVASGLPAAGAAAAQCPDGGAASPAAGEPYQRDSQETLFAHAREIMTRNFVAALVTTDHAGLPRVRSIAVSPPEEDFRVWVATSPISRKVHQIRARPEVALHYDDKEEMAAVTLMGPATIHTDLETFNEKNFFSEEDLRGSWPEFPDNFCMISIRPRWLEIVRIGKLAGDVERWRPQGTIL